jgi:hypothetical protein
MKTVSELKHIIDVYFALVLENKPIPENIQQDVDEYIVLVKNLEAAE